MIVIIIIIIIIIINVCCQKTSLMALSVFFFWNTEIVIAILKLKIHTKSGLYAKNWSSKFKNFQKYPRFSLWLPAFLCCL